MSNKSRRLKLEEKSIMYSEKKKKGIADYNVVAKRKSERAIELLLTAVLNKHILY